MLSRPSPGGAKRNIAPKQQIGRSAVLGQEYALSASPTQVWGTVRANRLEAVRAAA
jgi:hypothetical protein